MRRPYTAESAINPGCGVVQGSEEGKVKHPSSAGAGDFIGVYAFESNQAKAVNDRVGIAIAGVVKVRAGGSVNAGKKAVLKADASGTFVEAPTAVGVHPTCGTFLQSGSSGEYLDMIVERASVTNTV